MACVGENLSYPRAGKGMEEGMLTFDDVTSVPKVNSGVRIRELDDGYVNPEPIKHEEEEAEHLWEEFLSPAKLKSLAGVRNLEDITQLEMNVNTRENSLGNFGSMLPNLNKLKLSNSIISTVRDLGTCLTNLRMLWMCRCSLSDLDGISSLSSLAELYLAFNDISDVSPVSMLDNLQVLDLEGNLVDEIAQVEFLTLCSSLKCLNLEGNPVCTAPHPDASEEELASYDYRKAVHQAVPSLRFLDDEPFLVEKVDGKPVLRDMPDSAKGVRIPDHLITDWHIINEGIKAVDVAEDDEKANRPSSGNRPSSRVASARPGTAAVRQRPATTARQRPGSAAGQRPGSAMGQRPGSAMGQRPGSAMGSQAEAAAVFQADDSSDLTHGSSEVICGNISKALKARRKNIQNFKPALAPFSDYIPIHIPEKSFEDDTSDSISKDDIFEELRQWRQEYSKMFADEEVLVSDSPPSSPRTDGSSTSQTTSPSSPPQHYTPSPPSSSHGRQRPSQLRRSLPNPPLLGKEIQRPNTAAEFRVRRFRHTSAEESIENFKMRTLHGDECFDMDKNNSTLSLATRLSASLEAEQGTEPRSSSAPVKPLRSRYSAIPLSRPWC
ncbi:leucine-rich repeat-containing protein 56 isoform X2 [Nematostella vectensis]|uniref:leucine-rich repeat-containing protein 56 isoform X2 n=1 Tax=Nematostella vectensis TaxID=45351 RepID=UPI00139043A6|nr:leucine-rich repeat-containing protein 56 isoform X2 [Nematostella vectensis]